MLPTPYNLGFSNGNEFDLPIAGWTKFWNDIFQPKISLDPNLVKALVASESGFRTKVQLPSKAGPARGLIQVTEQARKILGNSEGELRDFLITITKEQVNEPNTNIASGIRWLFHKKELAKHRLKREATWEEAIAEYKGILNQLGKIEKADSIMEKLQDYYTRLREKR